MARAAEIADTALDELAPMLADAPDRGRRPRRARAPHAQARRVRTELRHDRRQRPEQRRPPAPRDEPPHDRRGRHRHHRRRRARRRLPLRHDARRSSSATRPPSRREIYELVLEAQLAGLAAIRPGRRRQGRRRGLPGPLRGRGYGDWYLHGTGHGVGLDIHEDPFASQVSTATLQVGDVVTCEPGLYRGGFGGFRIEDLVTVTADGGRRLTHLSKDSPCLPSRPTT